MYESKFLIVAELTGLYERKLATMLSFFPVMEIGSVRTSSFHTHSNLFFPSVLIHVSPLCPHLFHCSPPHLLIPAFLSPQLYSIFFFALLLTPDPLSGVPPTLSAISTTPSIHIGLLCLPLGRQCNWLDPHGSLWSWFYQHYLRLSIENREWPVHQKGLQGPSSCGSKNFFKLVLTEDCWVDGISVPQLTSQNLVFIFHSTIFIQGRLPHYTAINSPQSKTLTHFLNLNVYMYISIQAVKQLSINSLIIINIFSLV